MSSFPSSSKAIGGLLGAALALCTNLPEAQAALSRLPAPVALELVDALDLADDLDRAEVATQGRRRILSSLALDSRAAIRRRVAEAAGRLWEEDAELGNALLRHLADDGATDVRAAAARGLAHLLTQAPARLRAQLESSWATARSAQQRFALGVALAQAQRHFLTDLVVQELALDRDGSVRWAALRAAEAHLDEDPVAYTRLALARVSDPERAVRDAARRLLREASRRGWAVADRPGPGIRRADRRRFRRALRQSSARSA